MAQEQINIEVGLTTHEDVKDTLNANANDAESRISANESSLSSVSSSVINKLNKSLDNLDATDQQKASFRTGLAIDSSTQVDEKVLVETTARETAEDLKLNKDGTGLSAQDILDIISALGVKSSTDITQDIANSIAQEVTNRDNAISTSAGTKVNKDGTGLSASNISALLVSLGLKTSVATTTEIASAISSEVTNRNSAISSAISSEESARNSAIASAINTESTNRASAISSATEGSFKDEGTISASDSVPSSGVKKGAVYRFTESRTFISESVETGQTARALIDDPSLISNWFISLAGGSGGGGGGDGGTPDDDSVGADQIKGSDATAIRTKLDVNSKAEDTTALNLKFNNSGVIDEDDFSSDSDTKVPTQQSAKKYITDEALKKADIALGNLSAENVTSALAKLNVNTKTEDSTALDLKVNTSLILDEDDMNSDSATNISSQQAIKAYVDAETNSRVSALGGKADVALGNLSTENVASALTKLNVNTKTEDTTALNLKVNTSDVIDEDDFSSDSDTKLATQQSIKAYADAINNSLSTLITAEANARTDADIALDALVGIENWTGSGGVSTTTYSQDQLVLDGLTNIVYRAVSGRPIGTTRPTLDTGNWRVAHADNIIGVSSTNISADTTFANSSARVFVTPPAEGLTLTLPSSPDYGVQLEIIAIGGVSGRSITIDPNGNELQGSSDDFVINESRFADTLVSNGTNWYFLSHYQRLFDIQSSTTTLEGSNRFQVNSLLVGATGTIFEENADDFTNLETNVSRTTNSVSNATGVTSIDFALSANGGSSSASDASLHTVNDGGSGLQNRLNVMISGDATPLGEDNVVLVNGSINYIRIQSTQFFTLDLSENKNVSMFIFKHLSIDYGSNGWGGTRNLKIEGSTDNSNFTTLIDGDISTFSRVKDVHYETATLTFTEGSYRYIKATWDAFGVRDSDQTGLPNNPFADVLYSAGVKGLGFAYEDNAFDIEIVNESSIIAPASLIIKNESGVELTDSEYLITHKVNGGDFGALAIPSVFKALAPITAGANFYLKASIIGGANIADASISTPVTNTQFSSDALKTQTINGVVQEYNYRGSYIEVYLSANLAETSGDSATLTGRIQFDQEDNDSNINSDFTNDDGIVTCNFEGKVNIKAFLIALAGSGVTGSRPSYEIIKNADDASQSTERLLLVGNADESKFTNINSETTIDVESGDTIVLSHELASADISVQVGSKMILTRIRG